MSLLETLKRRRSELGTWLTERGLAHTFCLSVYQLQRETERLVEQHASGPCLDAGSGRSPWKGPLEARGIHVISLDVEDRAGGVDLIADLQDMPEVADGSMGTVLCTQVLEHVPRPWDAVSEISRVLAPGGTLILSVPHLSMLHEVPHDYFRYTRYGLASLLEARGLSVEEMRECGGLVALLSHLLSMALMTTLATLPGLRRVIWAINYAVLVRAMAFVDAAIGLRDLYPCNYVVLARKSGGSADR